MPNTAVRAAAEGMPALNRRRLLLGLAAASTAAAAITVAPGVHSAEPAAHPDAALFLLDKEMDKATAAMNRALKAARRIDKKCDKLFPPEPPIWEEPAMPEDVRTAFNAMTVQDLVDNRAAIYVAWCKEVGEQRAAHKALRAAHRAKVDEIQREFGADTAEDVFNESVSAQYDVGERILATPANTVEGLLVKLRVADDLDLHHAAENDALVSIAADIRRWAGVA
ncbi:hypothetical protein LB521_09275 [Mesorhizobium sp. BR-1-1-8]|uniref:hypothetical protein n=1 Tax=unclassified Mesorhizobium TaxID=325217 RepID=UPI001125BA17|nr:MULTISPECIES: hypothetical protein [unclassified Mesorhizobium]MBZ9981349.1 hypothetical protein [Mesorhizobium sp. BR-1-1-8]TPL33740.1 hypothetical protein FJ947_19315 [Mesorhizobium sp. B2-4-8]